MNHNPAPAAVKVLDEALRYHGLGFSLIPIKPGEKSAAVRRWKPYQSRPADEDQIREWFAAGSYGIGVIFGEVSGGLISRDFDDENTYKTWAKSHPSLATDLPTVRTARGFHVYAIATDEDVTAALRNAGIARSGRGSVDFGDGELRASEGCYSVLPPSVHPRGHRYSWTVELGDEIPHVDVASVFLPPLYIGEYRRNQEIGRERMR